MVFIILSAALCMYIHWEKSMNSESMKIGGQVSEHYVWTRKFGYRVNRAKDMGDYCKYMYPWLWPSQKSDDYFIKMPTHKHYPRRVHLPSSKESVIWNNSNHTVKTLYLFKLSVCVKKVISDIANNKILLQAHLTRQLTSPVVLLSDGFFVFS